MVFECIKFKDQGFKVRHLFACLRFEIQMSLRQMVILMSLVSMVFLMVLSSGLVVGILAVQTCLSCLIQGNGGKHGNAAKGSFLSEPPPMA